MIRSRISLFNNKLSSEWAMLLRPFQHVITIESQSITTYGPCILSSETKDDVFHVIDLKNLNFTTRHLLEKTLEEKPSDIRFLYSAKQDPIYLNASSAGGTIKFEDCKILSIHEHEKLGSLIQEALCKLVKSNPAHQSSIQTRQQ